MKQKILLPLLAAMIMAGCADRAEVTAPEAPQHQLMNQSPVAVMTNWNKKPMFVNGQGVLRFEFHGNNSYDPDGYITSYFWYPQYHCRIDPGHGSTYHIDIPQGETCGLSLTVTDNSGATGYTVGYYSWP
jgi:hypothetical protein